MEIYAVERDVPTMGISDLGYYRDPQEAERVKNEWNAKCIKYGFGLDSKNYREVMS